MSQIRMHLDLANDLPEIPADPHQLQQVFLNLINNAVDAILETGSEGDLWVRSGVDGNQIFVEFQDSGPGVKDASRVFDPFYTTKPVGKGTGLGLSICYGIISEHGGAILVRNESQKGATFRIELPLRAKLVASKASETPANTARSSRILVLDENESVLETVASLLAENDHNVVTTTSRDEAQRLVGTQEFELVIADWEMAATKSNRKGPSEVDSDHYGLGSRILWMSSLSSGTKGMAHLKPKGALQKPFRPGELLDAVNAALLGIATPVIRQ